MVLADLGWSVRGHVIGNITWGYLVAIWGISLGYLGILHIMSNTYNVKKALLTPLLEMLLNRKLVMWSEELPW